MEIRGFAEGILFGETLQDKLTAPTGLVDGQPGLAIRVPILPCRPPGLALDDPRPKKKFPGLTEGGDPRLRGLILHYFANHELLAIELMALFLLRFPNAPPAFRRAVVGTIGEEQAHLRLYRDRMADFGVGLGDVPVSRFFWDCLAQMSSPLEYLSGMSLTFEQANLDFARHYMNRFRALGDGETASLLERIYDDEIGHVKLGVVWFEKLRDAADRRPFWDRYRASLRSPLTPARAVGLGFDREARETAGLSPDYIERLQAFSHSKGRTPSLYLFNPGAEIHLAHGHRVVLPQTILKMAEDLETLPMFLASADDAVLVHHQPRPGFLARLRQAGIKIPQFITRETLSSSSRVFAGLNPWAWSPDSLAEFGAVLAAQPELAPPPLVRSAFEKTWSIGLAGQWAEQQTADWLAPATVVGTVHDTTESALAAVDALFEGGRPVVIKAPLGSAGRGMMRVLSAADRPRTRPWIQRTIDAQGGVVVEPWLAGVIDLSVQIVVTEEGRIRVLGVTRFETDTRGQYQGTVVGRPFRDLPESLRRFLIGPGGGWRVHDHLQAVGRFVGKALHAIGHRGPAGVDALVYGNPERGYRLKPIVEVNPRFTMGHLALRLGKGLGNRWAGRFRIITVAMAKKAGWASLGDYADGLGEGSLCLTDAATAQHAIAVLETTQRVTSADEVE